MHRYQVYRINLEKFERDTEYKKGIMAIQFLTRVFSYPVQNAT